MIQKQLEVIAEQIDALRDVLERNRADVEKAHADKADMRQETWRLQKNLSALQRIATDFDGVDAERQRLLAERAEVRERLEQVLAWTRAVRNGLSD